MNVDKHLHMHLAIRFFVLLIIITIPVCVAAFDDTFVLSQDVEESIVRDAWEKGELDRTQSLLDSALAKYPESAKLWDIQAGVALKQRNYEKAAEAENRALELSPSPLRHSNLGWIYRHLEQYNRAVIHYKMGLTDVQTIKENYFYLADCLEQTGRKDQAAKYYQQYLDIAPAGPKRNAAGVRLALLQGTDVSGGLAGMPPGTSGDLASLTDAQRRRADTTCNQKYPGLVAVGFDPETKTVTCGCPNGGIDIGEGCLCREELEIIRAVNERDIDRAEQLAAQVEQGGFTFYSNVLEDVRFLVRIKKETPWMLDDEMFKEEMARRDLEFQNAMRAHDRQTQNAMREHDRQRQQSDEQWGRLIQGSLETQLAVINGVITAMGTPGTEQFIPDNHQAFEATGELGKIVFSEDADDDEMTDRIVLLNKPVPDNLDPGEYDWSPPLNVDQNEIVGVWQCELFKIAVMKTGERKYAAKVLETYPVPKKEGEGATRYPFASGEIFCKVGEGTGGGSDVFLKYSGSGWLWDAETGRGRKWDRQDLVLKSDEDGLYLRLARGEADGHYFPAYEMRKVQ